MRKWKSGLHDNDMVNSDDEEMDVVVESIEAESMDDSSLQETAVDS